MRKGSRLILLFSCRIPLLILLLLAGSVAANFHMSSQRSIAGEGRIQLPQAQWLVPLSFGYRNLWAEVLWIRAISWFGGHTADADYAYLAELLKAIVHLNPRAEHAYYIAGTVLPWATNSTHLSRPLLEQAMRNLPEDWHWPYNRGFNAYWFDNDKEAAARLLARAARLPGAPPSVARLALRMQASSGRLDAARMFLEQMLKEKQDSSIRGQLLNLSKVIETEQVLRALDARLASFPHRFHDMRDLWLLRQAGVDTSQQLPDGGRMIVDSHGEIVSSISRKRFRVFVPPKRKVHP